MRSLFPIYDTYCVFFFFFSLVNCLALKEYNKKKRKICNTRYFWWKRKVEIPTGSGSDHKKNHIYIYTVHTQTDFEMFRKIIHGPTISIFQKRPIISYLIIVKCCIGVMVICGNNKWAPLSFVPRRNLLFSFRCPPLLFLFFSSFWLVFRKSGPKNICPTRTFSPGLVCGWWLWAMGLQGTKWKKIYRQEDLFHRHTQSSWCYFCCCWCCCSCFSFCCLLSPAPRLVHISYAQFILSG